MSGRAWCGQPTRHLLGPADNLHSETANQSDKSVACTFDALMLDATFGTRCIERHACLLFACCHDMPCALGCRDFSLPVSMSEQDDDIIQRRRNPLVIVGECWADVCHHARSMRTSHWICRIYAVVSTGCGLTAGVLVVGLIAFKQVITCQASLVLSPRTALVHAIWCVATAH